ncbi:MAG: hypothetical protein ACREMF_03615 [Gemmatimonadales bacterium]
MYDGARVDVRALEQLEGVLREVAEELATWRARALKAEADTKGGAPRGGGGGHARGDGEGRGRVAELETENRQLRARVETARKRVQELLGRMAFLEEQSREAPGVTAGGATPR